MMVNSQKTKRVDMEVLHSVEPQLKSLDGCNNVKDNIEGISIMICFKGRDRFCLVMMILSIMGSGRIL